MTAAGILFAQPSRAQNAPPPTGTCEPGTTEAFIDISNVRAKITNNGVLFWNGGRNVYEVPKGSGNNAIFSAGLWLGGLVDDTLRTAGSMYGPYEFWPGPIGDIDNPPADCTQYDDIHLIEQQIDGSSRMSSRELEVIAAEWPADLGAPYSEENNTPGYQPEDGDAPMFYGEQMAWWVMNDVGNVHEKTGTPPLGVEVRAAAYAWDEIRPASNTTFYRYSIVNRSGSPIDSLYIGLGVDVDLGAAFDDLVGTDTTTGMLYSYNADNDDDGNYGKRPPAVGMALIDANQPQPAFGGDPPRFTNTMMWYNGGGIVGDPRDGEDYYGYMRNRWTNGALLTYGDIGLYGSLDRANYIFPGDPVTQSWWSALNTDNAGGRVLGSNQKMVGSYGPVHLPPGDTLDFTVAFVWSRGADNLYSVSVLRQQMKVIRSAADDLMRPRVLQTPADQDEQPVLKNLGVSIYPNPAAEQATLRLATPRSMQTRIDVFDALGRRVTVVVDARLPLGDRTWTLETAAWPPGVYLMRIQLDHITETRRLVVVR